METESRVQFWTLFCLRFRVPVKLGKGMSYLVGSWICECGTQEVRAKDEIWVSAIKEITQRKWSIDRTVCHFQK